MTVLSEHYNLSNGVSIPKLGFGTWQTPNAVAPGAVRAALRLGYRHIDTARAYQNEEGVGEGLRVPGVARDQVFITSKVPAECKTYEEAKASIQTSLSELKAGPLDLLLIHAPKPWPVMFTDTPNRYFKENIAVWTALEEAYERGDVRAIGVSNFAIDDIENLTKNCEVVPMANQIRFHIGHTQDDLVAYCQARGILIEAYSPLGTGRLLHTPEIQAVASAYDRSVAQICIRYALQKKCLPLPKSVHEDYIAQNAQVDFEISAEDMARLDGVAEPAR